MKRYIGLIVTFLLVFLFTGCSNPGKILNFSNDSALNQKMNRAIIDMADQIQKSTMVKIDDKIALTTFVDLHRFDKTTYFGRKISESFFNELHVRGFKVIDLRGTKTIRVNNEGEFFISREINHLDKKKVETSFTLVGTYSSFGDGVMMNARIIDNEQGDIVASARTIVDNVPCSIYEGCKPKKVVKKKRNGPSIPQKRIMSISGAKATD